MMSACPDSLVRVPERSRAVPVRQVDAHESEVRSECLVLLLLCLERSLDARVLEGAIASAFQEGF